MNTLAPLIAFQKTKQDELVKQNCIVNRLLLTAELTDQQFQKLREAQNVRNSIKETLLEIQNSIDDFINDATVSSKLNVSERNTKTNSSVIKKSIVLTTTRPKTLVYER